MIQVKTEIIVSMVKAIRVAFKNDELSMEVLGKSKDPSFAIVVNEFLSNDGVDVKLAHEMSKLQGSMLETRAIAKLSYKLPTYKTVRENLSAYMQEKSKLILAKTLLNGLVSQDVIKRTSKVNRYIAESGKTVYRKEISLHFNGEESKKDILRGLHTIPGELLSPAVHGKPGAKVMKLTGAEKQFMKGLSSIAFRLVRVSDTKLREYYQQTEWYKETVKQKKEDPILLEERIKRYISIIKELEGIDRLYLSNWNDTRRRVYYELTMLGINPQGDSFETHMWELADAKVIDENGKNDLIWAAVVLATGRKNHAQALKYWDKNEAKVKDILLHKGDFDFGERFYNTRLLSAINLAERGEPSRFLLGFDLV